MIMLVDIGFFLGILGTNCQMAVGTWSGGSNRVFSEGILRSGGS